MPRQPALLRELLMQLFATNTGLQPLLQRQRGDAAKLHFIHTLLSGCTLQSTHLSKHRVLSFELIL